MKNYFTIAPGFARLIPASENCKKNPFKEITKKVSLFAFCLVIFCCQAFAQQITVHGKVLDSKTQANLVGATITVAGTQAGTVSNENGEFSIKANVGDQLKVQSVGYSESVVTITNASDNITVQLDAVVQSLNNVVVIGYGTSKKKDLTGAVASIKLENSPVALLPNVNVLDALKGR